MTELYHTESPMNRTERNNVNGTWEDILRRFTNLQRQINILAGGVEVDELIQRLNDAIDKATVAVDQAIEANNTATQEAIEVNNKALQTAIEELSDAISQLDSAIASANDAADNANEAKKGTLEATAQAQTAISEMQSLIKNTGPKGTWDDKTQYYKNNLAEVDGRTYIALKENINTPVTDKSTWALFADKGAQGADGPRGLPGKDGKDGTGVNIITGLDSEDELPPTGSPGDAYMIHGDLYVWQENSGTWKNVGPIQGPEGKSAYDLAVKNGFEGTMEEWIESLKGPPGPPGPEGPPGPPADLTEIYQTVDELKNEVTEHSAQIATKDKLGHIMPDGETLEVDKEGVARVISGGYQLTDGVKLKTYTGSLDNLIETGFYQAMNYSVPKLSIANVLVMRIAVNMVTQVAFGGHVLSGKPEENYKRSFVNGTWSSWEPLTKVELNDTLTSSSTTQAATANAVKQVNDKIKLESEKDLTLLNGWIGKALYYKEFGTINLYLDIREGTTSGGTVIGRLPNDYRHRYGGMTFPATTYSFSDKTTTGIIIDIENNGNININYNTPSKNYITAVIQFKAFP